MTNPSIIFFQEAEENFLFCHVLALLFLISLLCVLYLFRYICMYLFIRYLGGNIFITLFIVCIGSIYSKVICLCMGSVTLLWTILITILYHVFVCFIFSYPFYSCIYELLLPLNCDKKKKTWCKVKYSCLQPNLSKQRPGNGAYLGYMNYYWSLLVKTLFICYFEQRPWLKWPHSGFVNV